MRVVIRVRFHCCGKCCCRFDSSLSIKIKWGLRPCGVVSDLELWDRERRGVGEDMRHADIVGDLSG